IETELVRKDGSLFDAFLRMGAVRDSDGTILHTRATVIDITARKVKVLTLHSAKGLEFPFVAVVGLDAGRLPRQSDGLPPEEEAAVQDEQRRLFYVGCSRAMRALLVCGSQEAPSPFLDGLRPPHWERGEG
ncbi:MAG: ATP-binding domain-containing protein, partial [Chloroflexales bacterium]|nr:ATP-binding domain-containing protein [Chloroflexales bacterium]